MIAWVDVETTGLDPRVHHLLEVGVIVTDDELDEVGRTSVLLAPPAHARVTMKAEVVAMHEDNGLWAEARDEGYIDRYRAQSELCLFLRRMGADDAVMPVMGGSSVHFDRAWLKYHLPLFEEMFHYRNIDVSTLKELNRRWHFAEEWTGDRDIHRSLPDLEDTIAHLRHYHEAIDHSGCVPMEQA